MLLGFVFCAVSIACSGFFNRVDDGRYPAQRALVLSVENIFLDPDPLIEGRVTGQQRLEVEILTGRHTGSMARLINIISRDFYHYAEPGMELLVYVQEIDGQVVRVDVAGHSRGIVLYALVALFLFTLLAIGRKKGVYSAISLIITICSILFFMLPLILRDYNPILVTVITALLITVFNICLVSDISLKSLSAICGTFIGVTIAGITSAVAGYFGRISGLNMAHAQEILFFTDGSIAIQGLLTAGIILAALGAVIDVGMSISSAVFEMKSVSPNMSFKELYQSGMNIGGDIMGTMSNTLILAFAGSSITVLVTIALHRMPYMRLINFDLLGIEVIQGISASIGLILTIPITAALSSFLTSENKVTAFLKDRGKFT